MSLNAPDEGSKWEQAIYGADVVDRLQNIAQSSLNWRTRAGYQRTDAQQEANMGPFSRRVHTWGKHVLQMTLVDEESGNNTDSYRNVAKQQAIEAKQR